MSHSSCLPGYIDTTCHMPNLTDRRWMCVAGSSLFQWFLPNNETIYYICIIYISLNWHQVSLIFQKINHTSSLKIPSYVRLSHFFGVTQISIIKLSHCFYYKARKILPYNKMIKIYIYIYRALLKIYDKKVRYTTLYTWHFTLLCYILVG